MIGIEYNLSHCSLYIISVYLPSRSGCTDDIKESLDQLDAAITLLSPGTDIIIMGDFNADLGLLGGPKASTEVNEQGRYLGILFLHICIFRLPPCHIRMRVRLILLSLQ